MFINKRSTGQSAALVVAGCAAACVGVAAVPTFFALGLGGVLGGGLWAALSGDVWLALAALAISGGVWAVLKRRQRQADCNCALDAGCHTGNTCDLPASKAD